MKTGLQIHDRPETFHWVEWFNIQGVILTFYLASFSCPLCHLPPVPGLMMSIFPPFSYLVLGKPNLFFLSPKKGTFSPTVRAPCVSSSTINVLSEHNYSRSSKTALHLSGDTFAGSGILGLFI